MSSMSSETTAHVAGEVRAELARQRLAMREAARRLGVTSSWLHRRVTGDTDFTVSELAELADLLGVPVEKFLRGRKHSGAKFVHYVRSLRHIPVITRLSFNAKT
jgi:transcriptional regulator with XRE-family HTH domain